MNKTICTVMMTALLVLLMAGSAMCATYDSSVTLENKDDDWSIIDDSISATVDFNSSGDVFEWHVYGCVGLEPAECYFLIYYADDPEKDAEHDDWGGHHPGAVITHFDPNGCGEFDKSGTTELNMNLPSLPDGNIDVHDYSDEPDYYDPGCGAKLWIVPCDDYNEEECRLFKWNHDAYLFETSLIWYDDTNINLDPIVTRTWTGDGTPGWYYEAGEEVILRVQVRDYDGVGDLENMVVTANFSEYGIEELVTLEFDEMVDCIHANYSAAEIFTLGINDDDPRTNDPPVCGDINASDPSGLYDNERDVCFKMLPGSCAYMELQNLYDEEDELRTVALTQLSYCNVKDYSKWWSHHDRHIAYMIIYTVELYDEYGNHIGNIRNECCDDFTATLTGEDASIKYCGYGRIIMVNENNPCMTTLSVHCVDSSIPDITQEVEFLNPISSLEVTSDVDVLYAPDDVLNITAQILDVLGDPIPMPGIEVRLYDNSIDKGWIKTDENGSVTYWHIVEDLETGDNITFRVEAECREGSLTLEVVEPTIDSIEVFADSPMDSNTTQTGLDYVCLTDHGTWMDCNNGTWSCDIGEINDTTGDYTSPDVEGVATITVEIDGVTGSTEIIIDAESVCVGMGEGAIDCPIAGVEFTLTSGTVSITGNYSGDNGYACVQAMGIWDPECEDATKYAWVWTNEDVILDLNGTGDMYMLNRTSEVWEFYAAGDTAEVEGDERYALVAPVDPCDGVSCPLRTCVGYDLWSYICVDGVCVKDTLLEVNSVDCGYEAPSNGRSSGSSGGGGIYPPTPTPTPVDNATDNETDQDDPTSDYTKPADAKPLVNLPGGDNGDDLDTTPDDKDKASGGYDPTNAILIVLALLAVCVIGYVIYQKSQR